MGLGRPMQPNTVHDPSGTDGRHGYVIVASAFILMSIIWTAFYSFGIFFKPVLSEFGWTRAMTAGAFSLCSLVQGPLSITMGGLTDRLGARFVMTLCGVFLAAGYLLMSQLNAMWQLYLFFSVILGIGMGGSFVPLMTVTARWFVKKRGMMTGIVVSGTGVGTLVGPPAAGALISHYGWRTSYAILGGIVLVVMLLCAQLLRPAPGEIRKNEPDNDQQNDQQDDQQKQQQAIHMQGIDYRDATRSGKFWTAFAMIFCLGFCIFAIMVHIAAHVTDLGFDQATAATVMATIGAVCIVGRILFGKLLDRIGSRKGFVIGFAMLGLSLFLLVSAGTLSMLYLFAALFGFAFGACVTCESPLVADLFGLRFHGLLLGIVACGFTFGGAAGPFLAGYLFDVVGTYQAAFLFCGVVSCAGLLLAWVLRRSQGFTATGHSD